MCADVGTTKKRVQRVPAEEVNYWTGDIGLRGRRRRFRNVNDGDKKSKCESATKGKTGFM